MFTYLYRDSLGKDTEITDHKHPHARAQDWWLGKRRTCHCYTLALQVTLMVKNLSATAGDVKRCRYNPWVGKST